jgi:hypothetical protein
VPSSVEKKSKQQITTLKLANEQRDVPLPEDIFGPNQRGNIKSFEGGATLTGGGSVFGSFYLTIAVFVANNGGTYVTVSGIVTSDGWYSNPTNPQAGLYLTIHWVSAQNSEFGNAVPIPAINVPCGAHNLIFPSWTTPSPIDPIFDLIANCDVETMPGYSWFQC